MRNCVFSSEGVKPIKKTNLKQNRAKKTEREQNLRPFPEKQQNKSITTVINLKISIKKDFLLDLT